MRAIGSDLAGAFVFKPVEEEQIDKTQPSFRLLEEAELIERLNIKEEFGLLTWDDKPRLSVAGVQDKLNVFMDNTGNLGFGDGALCSTHILKFGCKNIPLKSAGSRDPVDPVIAAYFRAALAKCRLAMVFSGVTSAQLRGAAI